MRCAKRLWQRDNNGEDVTLDGVGLHPPSFVGGTVAFNFKMPARNNWEHAPGRTHGRMAVYGAASILRPLSPGSHTLVVIDAFKHPSSYDKVTHQLSVG